MKAYEQTKGNIYGKLKSTGEYILKPNLHGYDVPYIICECECGTVKPFNYYHLKLERINSCGCLRRKPNNKYGASSDEIKVLRYRYEAIISRCYDASNPQYKNYGAIGISMCQKWKDDFGSFVKWSLSNGFKKELTIDRKDVLSGYSPDNCRWITNLEQQHNKKNTLYIYDNGVRRSLAEMCIERNFNYATAFRRYKQTGLRNAEDIFYSGSYIGHLKGKSGYETLLERRE